MFLQQLKLENSSQAKGLKYTPPECAKETSKIKSAIEVSQRFRMGMIEHDWGYLLLSM